jgi:hypothetical protein
MYARMNKRIKKKKRKNDRWESELEGAEPRGARPGDKLQSGLAREVLRGGDWRPHQPMGVRSPAGQPYSRSPAGRGRDSPLLQWLSPAGRARRAAAAHTSR